MLAVTPCSPFPLSPITPPNSKASLTPPPPSPPPSPSPLSLPPPPPTPPTFPPSLTPLPIPTYPPPLLSPSQPLNAFPPHWPDTIGYWQPSQTNLLGTLLQQPK
ncbi:unnamed protein product [Closterium sp. Naga37s-1]|nr:unnamed protein product [Closterium sp. Naga37s-1]